MKICPDFFYVQNRTIFHKIDLYDEILINIHGGSKNNRGVIISGNTHIINPGGIDQGKFAILELERDPLNNYKWKIKSINLETL